MNQRIRFMVLLGVLLAIALGYYFISTDRSTDLVLIGTVDANTVVVSTKVMGRIEKLTVDEGSDVKQGDLIATIDSEELGAQKNAAQAQVKSAWSQLGAMKATAASTTGEMRNSVLNAQANLQATQASLSSAIADRDRQAADTKRFVALADQGVMSQQQRDQAVESLRSLDARVVTAREQVGAAEAALKVAQARLNQAQAAESNVAATRGQWASYQAQYQAAQTRYGYTNIASPVSGKVSVRVSRQGEIVNPGTPIVTIVDLGQTWVYAAIPETNADAVKIGDTLKVRMPSGATVDGKIIAKAAEGDFATQRDVSRRKRDIKTVRLKLLIDNPGMKYVPGMTAEVLVPNSKLVSK